VVAFAKAAPADDDLPGILEASQRRYLGHILLNSFKWDRLVEVSTAALTGLEDRNIADQAEAYRFLQAIAIACRAQQDVANKFRNQLNGLLNKSGESDYTLIHERTQKAVEWFLPRMEDQLIATLDAHISAWAVKKRTKKYVEELKALYLDFKRKKEQLTQCLVITAALAKGDGLADILSKAGELPAIAIGPQELPGSTSKPTPAKGETKRSSLKMFQAGKGVDDIAAERGLTRNTIVGHLIEFIGNGVEADQLMDADKLASIQEVLRKNPGKPTALLKGILGNDVEYAEIRIAQASI